MHLLLTNKLISIAILITKTWSKIHIIEITGDFTEYLEQPTWFKPHLIIKVLNCSNLPSVWFMEEVSYTLSALIVMP